MILFLIHPNVFARDGVKSTELQASKLQTKSGSKFLEFGDRFRHSLFVFKFFASLDDISVMAEKDEVPLVVEGGDLSTVKFGPSIKKTSEHSSKSVTKSGVEVVEDDLRAMTCFETMIRNFFTCLYTRELVMSCRAVGKMNVY